MKQDETPAALKANAQRLQDELDNALINLAEMMIRCKVMEIERDAARAVLAARKRREDDPS